MKRRILSALCLILLTALVGCKKTQTEPRSLETLKEIYPEYFEMSDFKGIEVYVWKSDDGSFRCGMMSGTNRMKTDEEIEALQERPLSIDEAKMILDESGIANNFVFLIPIAQPYTEYKKQINKLYE
ncbi:MAG: hypothetical protein J6036_05225 [Clostridia bacterium]|nr:hypothetical protein [Clostridia bacterium]